MKTPLTSKTQHLNIVINTTEKDISQSDVQAFCNLYFNEYAFIKHDKDIFDSGELKHVHYHIVGNAKYKSRLSTHLNRIVDCFELSNAFGVEIDKYQSLIGSIQYLIHKNDKDKYQYDIKQIVSNIPSDELETIIESVNDCLSFDRLLAVVSSSTSKIEIMREIGINNYRLYRMCILDMWNDLQEVK